MAEEVQKNADGKKHAGIAEMIACIELTKVHQRLLKDISVATEFSIFVINEAKRELPEVVQELGELKKQYHELTGKRYCS
ncbi:MAG: hypothetical protein Q7J54_07105 [Candidatus Woesearchaeota archaeon]|nr:hypothetical protein [Candidatus Woesearchaeota archaeon]